MGGDPAVRYALDRVRHCRRTVHWGSNTFLAEWQIEWAAEHLRIVARWDAVAGGYQDLLNTRSVLELDRAAFVDAWKPLPHKVVDAVQASHLRIADTRSFDLLRAAADPQ